MSKHATGRRHQSGSLQELATMMIEHLGGLDPDPEPEPVPTVDWVNYDTLMEQQRAGRAVQ